VATLSLEQVGKVYPNGVEAIHRLDLAVDVERLQVFDQESGAALGEAGA